MTTMVATAPLHGSYQPDDCHFLLTPIEGQFLSIEEKERRIQSGEAHYSEMIHREPAPSAEYLTLFDTLCTRYAPRLAREVRQLARQLLDDSDLVIRRRDRAVLKVASFSEQNYKKVRSKR